MEQQDQELEQLNRGLQETLESAQDEEYVGKRHHGHHYSHKKKRKKKKVSKITPYRVFLIILCTLAAVFLAALAIIAVLYVGGKSSLREPVKGGKEITVPEGVVLEEEGKYVNWQGNHYRYNDNIITLLCMGIDTSLAGTGGDNIGENEQVDTLFLTVIDTKTGKTSLISIPCDVPADVKRYTVESVSGLMYGIPIQGYVALDYQGISVLNDTAGGVPVQVLEDLTRYDPSLEEGRTILLKGQQAYTYVRSRDIELPDSNTARMERQKQYLISFAHTALEGTKSNLGLPMTLYQRASAYMYTDITLSEAVYLTSLVLKYNFSESDVYSAAGQIVKGEQDPEFVPDEEALYELILEVFYNKV